MPTPALQELQEYLDRITDGMKSIRRWQHYPDRARKDEDDNMHTVQTVLLCKLGFEIELAGGNPHKIDGYALLSTAVEHELGEPMLGDVRWDTKQHSLVGPLLEAIERQSAERDVIALLPEEAHVAFSAHYQLQFRRDDPTGLYFYTIEHVGYLIRGMAEYRHGSKTLGLEVFSKSWGLLKEAALVYESIRMMCDAWRDEVEAALATPEGQQTLTEMHARLGRARELPVDDLRTLIMQLPGDVRDATLAVLKDLDAKK